MIKKCIVDIETTGLSPTDSSIVCIGIKDCQTGETRVFWNADEEKMIAKFLEYYHKQQFGEIIGYNIGFDAQHIFAKILKYKIQSNGFLRSNVTDLMKILKSVKCGYTTNKPGSLNDWTTYLFGESKLETGSSVPQLAEEGQMLRIVEYNIRDVELTFKLWQRIQEVMA